MGWFDQVLEKLKQVLEALNQVSPPASALIALCLIFGIVVVAKMG